jgi:GTP-binding protein Era
MVFSLAYGCFSSIFDINLTEFGSFSNMTEDIQSYKAGYVAIIGRPNVGKSTLLNQLLNIKLSIVSPRPQTTRKRVMGFLSDDDSQAIFLDTPGMIDPKYELQQKLMEYVTDSISEADIIVLLLSVDIISKDELSNLKEYQTVKDLKKPLIIIVNKIDTVQKNDLIPFLDRIQKTFEPDELLPISAIKGIGTPAIQEIIKKYLPFHPPFYDPELLTEQPERFFVSELIRETIFHQFKAEIPYSTEVIIDEFNEVKGRKDVIKATIWVERSSQKGILIGKRGESLKRLGMRSRKEIEQFLDRPVFLELFVKVQENWRKNEKKLNQLGY